MKPKTFGAIAAVMSLVAFCLPVSAVSPILSISENGNVGIDWCMDCVCQPGSGGSCDCNNIIGDVHIEGNLNVTGDTMTGSLNMTDGFLVHDDYTGTQRSFISPSGVVDTDYHTYTHRKNVWDDYIGFYYGLSAPTLVNTAGSLGVEFDWLLGQSTHYIDLRIGSDKRRAGEFTMQDGALAAEPYIIKIDPLNSEFHLYNDTGINDDALMVFGHDENDLFQVKATADFTENVTAEGFITETDYFYGSKGFEGDALSQIRNMKNKMSASGWGEVDHKSYGDAHTTITRTEPVYEYKTVEICQDVSAPDMPEYIRCKNVTQKVATGKTETQEKDVIALTKLVSLQTRAIQQLLERVEYLENGGRA